eukprot:9467276-Pyramimonas_sp.AAC.2
MPCDIDHSTYSAAIDKACQHVRVTLDAANCLRAGSEGGLTTMDTVSNIQQGVSNYTSLALNGVRIFSSGTPRLAASSATADGGASPLVRPRPLGLPG